MLGTVPHTLPDIIADLYRRLADHERRTQNAKRTGTVHEIDEEKGLYRIKLGEDTDGDPFLTPWLPNQEIAMGGFKVAMGLTVGEQVDVHSETGDLTDAMIVASIQSDENPRPKVKPGQAIMTAGDKTKVQIDGSVVKITAPRIDINPG